ncbi:MAG: alpha/beta hydrolase [Longimicrobiales bacterium]
MTLLLVLLALYPVTTAMRSGRAPEVRRISSAVGDTVVATSYDTQRTGTQAPVILVPGLLGAAFTFREVAPRLSEAGYRVVIIEPLGFGASSRPKDGDYSLEAQAVRVGRALDSLGISSATLVCHSVGASICMRLSLQRPAMTRGIVSINGGPDEAAGTAGLRTSLKMAPIIKVFGAQRIIRGKVKDGLRESSADPAWVTDAVVKAYTAPFSNFNAVLVASRGMVNAREGAPLMPRLSSITAPFTLLVGASKPDKAISAAAIDFMAGSIKQLKVERVPGAGQYIQEERPDVIVQAVRDQTRAGIRALPDTH